LGIGKHFAARVNSLSFIRPEAQTAILQWREALLGMAILLLGLWWVSGSGILQWVGVAVALAGAVLIYTGVQRARFRAETGGAGVVTVDEGQISYFGPLSGGVASIADLALVVLDPTQTPPVWVLQQPRQMDVSIPVNAEGADQLFDAFAALPGIRTEHMLSALKTDATQPVVIWAKPVKTLH
jgi:hypothetical protein